MVVLPIFSRRKPGHREKGRAPGEWGDQGSGGWETRVSKVTQEGGLAVRGVNGSTGCPECRVVSAGQRTGEAGNTAHMSLLLPPPPPLLHFHLHLSDHSRLDPPRASVHVTAKQPAADHPPIHLCHVHLYLPDHCRLSGAQAYTHVAATQPAAPPLSSAPATSTSTCPTIATPSLVSAHFPNHDEDRGVEPHTIPMNLDCFPSRFVHGVPCSHLFNAVLAFSCLLPPATQDAAFRPATFRRLG